MAPLAAHPDAWARQEVASPVPLPVDASRLVTAAWDASAGVLRDAKADADRPARPDADAGKLADPEPDGLASGAVVQKLPESARDGSEPCIRGVARSAARSCAASVAAVRLGRTARAELQAWRRRALELEAQAVLESGPLPAASPPDAAEPQPQEPAAQAELLPRALPASGVERSWVPALQPLAAQVAAEPREPSQPAQQASSPPDGALPASLGALPLAAPAC